jgi:hypothetical protein
MAAEDYDSLHGGRSSHQVRPDHRSRGGCDNFLYGFKGGLRPPSPVGGCGRSDVNTRSARDRGGKLAGMGQRRSEYL